MQTPVSGFTPPTPGAAPGTTYPNTYDPNTYDTPIPGVAGYAGINLAANTAYKNTLARINQKRMASLRSAGYLGDVDPTSGVIKNMRVDPNNPYGGLQQMLRGQAGDFQQSQYAAEDRGLHGGLAHKADSELKYQHGGQAAQFGSDFAGALGGFQDEQNQAAYTRDSALSEAELQAARDAISGGDFNPGDYTGLDYPDYGQDPAATPPPAVPRTKAHVVAAKVIANKTKAAKLTARKVAANKSGATVQGRRGVISIH